jgi:hypothetical protein
MQKESLKTLKKNEELVEEIKENHNKSAKQKSEVMMIKEQITLIKEIHVSLNIIKIK